MNAADGTVVGAVRYWPFGAERLGTAPERGYTGQQKEPLLPLGMYYYKARFYSTATAHFVSADPVMPEASMRGFNRYGYAAANPLRYTDPTGHCFEWDGTDLTEVSGCTDENLLSWLACGIQARCGEIDGLYAMAQWVLSQIEFYRRVIGRATDSASFLESVLSIRAVERHWLSKDLHTSAWYIKMIGEGPQFGVPRFGLPFPVFTSASSRVVDLWLDYSYLDLNIVVLATKPTSCCSGEQHLIGMYVTVNSELEWRVPSQPVGGWGSGSPYHEMGMHLGISLWDPKLESLQVTFNVVLRSAPGALSPPQQRSPRSDPVIIR